MFRKLLFSALTALAFAGGILLASAIPGNAAPLAMSPAAQVQANSGLLDVARNCGPWNNWCRPRWGGGRRCGPWNNWCRPRRGGGNCGPWNNWCRPGRGGGASACINLGGVQFCVGGRGTNCHWVNGRRYCSSGRRPRERCVYAYGHRYCSDRYRGDCIRVNRRTYCRF